MSNETREHVSCLMDGELSQETAMFVVRRMGADRNLEQAWTRYHIIRDCLRKSGSNFGFEEPGVVETALPELRPAARWSGSRWLKPAAGFAMAASVAAVAVTLTLGQSLTAPGGTAKPEPFASPQALGLSPVSSAASFNAQDQAERQRLNSYLLRHNQASGAIGRQGFVSYVPIVATAPVQMVESETRDANPQVGPSAPAPDSTGTDSVAQPQD